MESPHKKLQSVSCHIGFNPEKMPNKENIKPINCTTCHKDVRIEHLFHVHMMRAGENDPELAESREKDIKNAMNVVRQVYSVNYFPEMKVSRRHYPNNPGHLNYNGCYRCHDGKHACRSDP